MSHEIDIPDLNENGTVFDDTYDVIKSDNLTNHEIQHLQDIFDADINRVTQQVKKDMRELAAEIWLDIFSSWNSWVEKTIQPKPIVIEQVELKDNEYQVQAGENLWNIVSEKYDLVDHREIAEMINIVVDAQQPWKMATRLWKDTKPDNFPDGIKWDQLWAWDIIYLPPRLEKT